MKGIRAIHAETILTPIARIDNGVIRIDGHRFVKAAPKDRLKVCASAA